MCVHYLELCHHPPARSFIFLSRLSYIYVHFVCLYHSNAERAFLTRVPSRRCYISGREDKANKRPQLHPILELVHLCTTTGSVTSCPLTETHILLHTVALLSWPI